MGEFIGNVLFAAFAFVIDALAIRAAWGWHAVPLGAPALSLWGAAGLSALYSLFAFRGSEEEVRTALEKKDDDNTEFVIRWTRRGYWLFCIGLITLIAWIAHLLQSA